MRARDREDVGRARADEPHAVGRVERAAVAREQRAQEPRVGGTDGAGDQGRDVAAQMADRREQALGRAMRLDTRPVVDRIDPEVRAKITLDTGYGRRFGVHDEQLRGQVGGILPRDEVIVRAT